MNDDLISRRVALDALTEYWKGISDRHPTLDGEMAVYADCKGIIKRLPSAQPEIIRCKDCKHCADDWNGNQPMFTCELGSCGESVMPNDFCSRAERL